MIRLLTGRARIGLVVAAMAVAVAMVAFAQTSEPAIESVPTEAEAEEVNASPTGDDMSEETEPPARSAIPAEVEVEIQRHINELRREQMDDRDTYFDRLLAIVAIVIAVAGYFSFKQFRAIKAEAGQNVMASKQYAEEARHLVEKIKAKQHEADSLVERISAQTVADKPSEANQVVSNVRENPEASPIQKSIGLAVSFQQQGKRDDAIEKWRAVAHITEGSDNDLAARAWFSVGYLIKDEDPEDALADYAEAIRLKPDYAEAYNNRGAVKDALGRHDDALADYAEAIRLKPDYAEAYNNRGALKDALGRHDDALADYAEAIRLKPDYAIAYANRGNVKTALGRHDDAIADQDEAIRLQPDLAIAYNNRGTVKGKSGRHTDAIADYDEAIRLQPDLAIAYNNRGAVKGKSGRYTDAIADCDEAIRLQPDLAEAYYNRGNAKKALGLKDEARKDFRNRTRTGAECQRCRTYGGSSGAITSRSQCRRGLMSLPRSFTESNGEDLKQQESV